LNGNIADWMPSIAQDDTRNSTEHH